MMTDLQRRLDSVRAAWRRTEMLKGVAVLVADAVIVVLALIAIDAIYHLDAFLRALLLVGGAGVMLSAAFLVIVRPLQRKIEDDDLALFVEGRFPDLKGSLVAAVEYERKDGGDALEAELVSALVADCLDKAAEIDLSRVVDRRRLATRGIAAGILLAFFLGASVVQREFFSHQLARVLTPWVEVPKTAREVEIENERAAAHEQELALLKQIEEARKPVVIELKVTPGSVELKRGAHLDVVAGANRVTGSFTLQFRPAGETVWRTLPMLEDGANAEKFTQQLSDISESLEYRVTMGEHHSDTFNINVLESAALEAIRLSYKFPKYSGLPDKTVSGMDGNIEAVEGTVVTVALVASGPLKSGVLQLDGKPIEMAARGTEVSATLTLKNTGTYLLRATDQHGNTVAPPTGFTIRVLKDEAPELEVVYPAIDTAIHPLEEAVFVARTEDSVGLKEVRLHSYFNSESEEVQRINCAKDGEPLKAKLAEFVIELEKRPRIKTGDTILYHFEAEDMKGQVTSSDVYTASVRSLQTFQCYGYHPVMPAHGPEPAELINIIGAAWNLQTKKGTLSDEEFNAQSEKIAKALEDKH